MLAASLALLASVVPAATFAQDDAAGEVTVMTYFSKDLGETALKELLAQFEADTGNTVNFVDVGHEDFKTGILIQLAGGNPPDVHSNWAGARTAFQVQNGMLAPIDEMWAANDLDSQFPQGLIDSAATYDGVKYLLPLGYHYAGMFYNPKTFEAAGIAVPTTWDEFKASCDAFNAAGIVPIALGSMNKWPAQFWFDYLLLRTAGPEYRAKLMAGEAKYTDPEVVRAMELWAELAAANCFTPDANAFDWTDAADQVANGEAAMNLMGTWITGYWNGNGLVAGHRLRLLRVPRHRRGRHDGRGRPGGRSRDRCRRQEPRGCHGAAGEPGDARGPDRLGGRPGRPAAERQRRQGTVQRGHPQGPRRRRRVGDLQLQLRPGHATRAQRGRPGHVPEVRG